VSRRFTCGHANKKFSIQIRRINKSLKLAIYVTALRLPADRANLSAQGQCKMQSQDAAGCIARESIDKLGRIGHRAWIRRLHNGQ